jgi:GNAT superfamily N-acetyltransferase
VFEIGPYRSGDLLSGEWWRVQDDADGHIVAYGWIDTLWGDAEMLLAVEPEGWGCGIGGFVLDHLEQEVAQRGINYLYNIVRPSHPDRDRVVSWLGRRGFEVSADGVFRRRIKPPHRVAE